MEDFIKRRVDEKVSCFSEGAYTEIGRNILCDDEESVSISGNIIGANACVVYFPSMWAVDLDRLVLHICLGLIEDGVLLIVEKSLDASGVNMCGMADRLKQLTRMPGVVDQQEYCGKVGWLEGHQIVFFQYWKKTSRVSLDDWVAY